MARVRIVVLSALVLVLVAVLAACNSANPIAPDELIVTVSGLPGGVSGGVLVTGPGAFSQAVTATTTLASLTPGTYTVTASVVTDGDAIVPTVFDGSVSSSSVSVTNSAGGSTTVSYAARPGTGHLWVPMYGSSLEAASLASRDLTTTNSVSADVELSAGADQGEAIAFDHAGNMWVSDYSGYIYRYDASELTGSGTQAPTVTIDATGYGAVLGLAFDASGDLWAADNGSYQLLMYTPTQLAAGGALLPSVVISSNSGGIDDPYGIAFDASGNLWVAVHGTSPAPQTVVAFTPAQLATTGSPSPAVVLSPNANSIYDPIQIAFDGSGNLWVGNDGGIVVRFNASDIGTTGNPAAAATITSAGANPDGLAFDASGALWVSDYNGGSPVILRRFTNPDALIGTVGPSPDVTLTVTDSVDYVMLAFSPPDSSLPINTP